MVVALSLEVRVLLDHAQAGTGGWLAGPFRAAEPSWCCCRRRASLGHAQGSLLGSTGSAPRAGSSRRCDSTITYPPLHGSYLFPGVCHVFVHEDIAVGTRLAVRGPIWRVVSGQLPVLDLSDAMSAAGPVSVARKQLLVCCAAPRFDVGPPCVCTDPALRACRAAASQ